MGTDDRVGQVPELPPATGEGRPPERADDRFEDRRRARQDLVETDLPGRANRVGSKLRFNLGLSQAKAVVNVGLPRFGDEGIRVAPEGVHGCVWVPLDHVVEDRLVEPL